MCKINTRYVLFRYWFVDMIYNRETVVKFKDTEMNETLMPGCQLISLRFGSCNIWLEGYLTSFVLCDGEWQLISASYICIRVRLLGRRWGNIFISLFLNSCICINYIWFSTTHTLHSSVNCEIIHHTHEEFISNLVDFNPILIMGIIWNYFDT